MTEAAAELRSRVIFNGAAIQLDRSVVEDPATGIRRVTLCHSQILEDQAPAVPDPENGERRRSEVALDPRQTAVDRHIPDEFR
jgi:hypothetical protein